MTYRDAGVDIDAGMKAVADVRELARKTLSDRVLSGVGGFGGLYEVVPGQVLVAGADGVGTKLKAAGFVGRYDTVASDLVNHCVNDILVQGARPLFFLDYIAASRLDPAVLQGTFAGLAEACAANGCALLGGETAELPGIYCPGHYDLAGFIVGIVSREGIITGERVRAGDSVVGLASAGLHTNGFSLAQKLLFEVAGHDVGTYVGELGCTVGEELLKPHLSYLRPIEPLLAEGGLIRGMAHITGGGLVDNIPRVLPEGLGVRLRTSAWERPPVFDLLQRLGDLEFPELSRTFNLGVGLTVIVPAAAADPVVRRLKEEGAAAWIIGEVVEGAGVRFED